MATKQVCVRVVSLGWGGKLSMSIVLSAGVWGLLVFVLLVFLRCALRCPMAVASNDGGKRFTSKKHIFSKSKIKR